MTTANIAAIRSPADRARCMAQAKRWSDRAEECRTLADEMRDSYCIISLHITARGYDRMIEHAKE